MEVDVEGPFTDSLRPKRKYRKRSNLSVSQRKSAKKYIPAKCTPTVEFKSSCQLRFEKRQNFHPASHSFQISIPPENNDLFATPNFPALTLPQSSADDTETDYYSDGDVSSTPSHYVQSCIWELAESNVLTKVLRKCEQKGVTHHFMALITQIASGTFPVTNMAFLLSLKVALLHSLQNSTQMGYRSHTSLF